MYFIDLVLNNNEENENIHFTEKTLLLKTKLIQRETVLRSFKQQINQVDQQLLSVHRSLQEESSCSSHSLPSRYLSLYVLELL